MRLAPIIRPRITVALIVAIEAVSKRTARRERAPAMVAALAVSKRPRRIAPAIVAALAVNRRPRFIAPLIVAALAVKAVLLMRFVETAPPDVAMDAFIEVAIFSTPDRLKMPLFAPAVAAPPDQVGLTAAAAPCCTR